MWEVRVTQKYMADYGREREDVSAFSVKSLEEAADIVAMFEKYGVGKIDYSITQKHIEEEA